MRFTIITPCRNAVDLLPATMESILSQTALRSGRVMLQYIVVDGASTDGTAELARTYQNRGVEVISEPDTGVYSALVKGLLRAEGDVVAYLNAGDLYHETAFEIVASVFEHGPASWLSGFNVAINAEAQVTSVQRQRQQRKEYFDNGFYGGEVFPTLQQESTFWKRELLSHVDFDKLASFRLAGDFYLWQTFAQEVPLVVVDGYLGAFRVHEGQLSSTPDLYLKEVQSVSREPSFREKVTAFTERNPASIFTRFLRPFSLPPSGNDIFYYSYPNRRWIPYR